MSARSLAARVAVAAATAAAAVLVAPAADAATAPTGQPCSWRAAGWDAGEQRWIAEVDAGPIVVAGELVTIRCTLASWYDGRDPNAVVTSDTTRDMAVVPPQVLSYPGWAGDVLCTDVVAGSTTWRWTGSTWSSDPAAWCPRSGYLPSQLAWVEGLVWCFFSELSCSPLDYVTCDPSLPRVDVPGVVEFGEDGDIYLAGELFWECPPYGI